MTFRRMNVAETVGGRQRRRYERADGLAVTFLLMNGFRRRFAAVGVPFGSIHKRFFYEGRAHQIPAGSAHFAEHLIFDNGDDGRMARLFELGAEANAYTTYTHTLFYFHASGLLDEALTLFLGAILGGAVDEARLETERKIIAAEIAMHRNDPDQIAFDSLVQNVYRTHALRDNIAGDEADIEHFDGATYELIRKAWYNGRHLELTIAGDLGEDEIESLLRLIDRQISAAASAAEPILRPENELTGVRGIELAGAIEQPRFLIGIKGDVSGRPEPPAERIAFERSLDLTLDSRIGPITDHYDRLVEDGLIDDSLFTQQISAPDALWLMIGGTSPRPDDAAEALLGLVDLAGREGPDLPRYATLARGERGRLARRLDSVPGLGAFAARCHLAGLDLADALALYDNMSTPPSGPMPGGLLDSRRATVLIYRPEGRTEEYHA